MDLKELESKLSKYYSIYNNPKHICGNWVIVNNQAYKKYKNKLKIESICSMIKAYNQIIIVVETKREYMLIKYNDRFICFRESETEYGLSNDNYDILAINKDTMDSSDSFDPLPFEIICDTMDWKLSRKAKQVLDYYN